MHKFRPPTARHGTDPKRSRDRLLEELATYKNISPEVMQAMDKIPRHLFIDDALSYRAYENTALPIGHSQTISQPYIVARMSSLAIAAGRPKSILEIGTGSGYQTAVLSLLAERVYSVERISQLLSKARRHLNQIGRHNVVLRFGDGTLGWPEKGPFDVIMVTAAAEEIPKTLHRQLATDGRMIIPIGNREQQQLLCCERHGEELRCESVEKVKFVPLRKETTHS